MASIFDDDVDAPQASPTAKEKSIKRSKHRESLTSTELASGKRRLSDMVTDAFNTLQQAMTEADHPTAIKAAQIILDRSGFGPKNTVDINTTNVDLSSLSREELADRAAQLVAKLRGAPEPEIPVDKPIESIH